MEISAEDIQEMIDNAIINGITVDSHHFNHGVVVEVSYNGNVISSTHFEVDEC